MFIVLGCHSPSDHKEMLHSSFCWVRTEEQGGPGQWLKKEWDNLFFFFFFFNKKIRQRITVVAGEGY